MAHRFPIHGRHAPSHRPMRNDDRDYEPKTNFRENLEYENYYQRDEEQPMPILTKSKKFKNNFYNNNIQRRAGDCLQKFLEFDNDLSTVRYKT